jgi:hypothetical protein
MRLKIRNSNAGHWIGLAIGIFVILMIVSFFKLTWPFWMNLYQIVLEPSIESLRPKP